MTLNTNVVALYVDPRGPYPELVAEWYDVARDARTYTGDKPVVAHPPCGPWGRLRHLCTKQDPGHAVHALEVVRRTGGALEHPADSHLWDWCAMPRPGDLPDEFGGVTIFVDQVRWGHVCQKRTWVYVVRPSKPWPIEWPAMPPPRRATKCISRDAKRKSSKLKRATKAECRLTPRPFAEWLIAIAEQCAPTPTPPPAGKEQE